MSLHRYAPKRDDNEPEIRARFFHHGWHTEQLSGKGMPDLLCFPPRSGGWAPALLVDVKDGKGKVTEAQEQKWETLAALRIHVYVARTEADVDAIVAGSADPWRIEPPKRGELAVAFADASGPLRVVRPPGSGVLRAPSSAVSRRRKP